MTRSGSKPWATRYRYRRWNSRSSSMRVRPRSLRARACVEQGVAIDRGKGLVHDALGDGRCDAGRFDLPGHAEAPAFLEVGLGSRDRAGDALVIEVALGFESGEGGFDRVRVVLTAEESLAKLRLR